MSVRLLDDPRDGLPVKVEPAEVGMLVSGLICLLVAFCLGYLAAGHDPATIGKHAVPGDLSCQEDEVITFDRNADEIPYPLGCVHYSDAAL
jgi:hypothetical protein